MSSREKQVRVSEGKKQEDPLSKQGIVGIFCRAYTVQDAIYKFLSDVYAPSVKEGRFDYIPGEGTAGVVIYDDKFAYSHHATDPAGGKLLNAFDLVRLHRFPEEDEKTSFLKMCAFAETDELVKEAVERERLAEAQKDFEETSSSWEEPLPFGRHTIVPFPLDALPPDIRNYVAAISESVQTPVDMAGCAALSVIATSVQGKFAIRGKPDWTGWSALRDTARDGQAGQRLRKPVQPDQRSGGGIQPHAQAHSGAPPEGRGRSGRQGQGRAGGCG